LLRFIDQKLHEQIACQIARRYNNYMKSMFSFQADDRMAGYLSVRFFSVIQLWVKGMQIAIHNAKAPNQKRYFLPKGHHCGHFLKPLQLKLAALA